MIKLLTAGLEFFSKLYGFHFNGQTIEIFLMLIFLDLGLFIDFVLDFYQKNKNDSIHK